MILQSLYEYYQRNKGRLPPKGFQIQDIKFVIEIDEDGRFLNLVDKREGKKGKPYLLPKAKTRSGSNSYQTTFLLWDHHGYLLAHPKEESPKAVEMAQKQKTTFIAALGSLPDTLKTDKGVAAVLKFYEKDEWKKVKEQPAWPDCARLAGCNMTFQLAGDDCLVPERAAVRFYQSSISDEDSPEDAEDKGKSMSGICLITGKKDFVKRLHSPTPVLGSRPNAKIPGFQKNSGFDSYGKEQAFNAPVSSDAEAAYTTALKYLISSESNKVIISDTTIVFWAQKTLEAFDLESNFVWFFKSDKDDTERGVNAVKALFNAVESGRLPVDEDNRFFVLGLAPNAARISVRFWKAGTIKEFAEKIYQHFIDFEITRPVQDKYEYLSLYQILGATVLDYKMDNVPPNLAGAVVSSILDGTPYPRTLLHQCMRRIRAEQSKKDSRTGKSIQNVNRIRASILKACLNRFNRIHNPQTKEVLVSLDRTNTDTGYRVGRLFAVLEKIQEEANPGINTTIRDRFYGAASSTPVTVFPRLLGLKNHHLPKLSLGRKVNMEREIQDIIGEIKSFPSHLTLDQQAMFAIGYYHQRQAFFVSKKDLNNE